MPARTLRPEQRSPTSRGFGFGEVSADLQVEVPDPRPAWLDSTTVAHEAYWGSPEAALITPAGLHVVRQYFDLFDEFERESDPDLRVKMRPQLMAFVKQLGLTPAAKKSLAVSFAKPAKPDEGTGPVAPVREIEDPRLRAVR